MAWRLTGSVGDKSTNSGKDVKLVKALLNVYFRSTKQTELKINTTVDKKTIAAINTFQSKYEKVKKTDGKVNKSGNTFKALNACLKKQLGGKKVITTPTQGSITWKAEGKEGGRYHSRTLHVPTSPSGLTLGRGYDMKTKSAAKISKELIKAGVPSKYAKIIKNAAKKKGAAATQFIVDNDLLDFQVSPKVQLALYKISFAEITKDAKWRCEKSSQARPYGTCDWNKLDYRIKEVIVDLRYRGDYKSSTMKHIQTHIVNNDFAKFKAAMLRSANWSGVPATRFNLRVDYLKNAKAPAKPKSAVKSKAKP